MEPIQRQVGEWLKDKQAKLAAMADKHRIEHEARMASLPPGTCEQCYGTGRIGGVDQCLACNPIETYAYGTPYEFHGSMFGTYRVDDSNRSAFEKARRFLVGDRDLYVCGGVGGGKTRLACAIANEWHRSGKGAMFIRAPLMLHQLQPGRQDDDRAEFESRLFHTPLLVIDDLGAERDQATDFTRRTLLMIYEARHDARRRTIFTSNKSLQELGDMQEDDRLSSRIAGRCDVVRLTTPDQRLARRGPQT